MRDADLADLIDVTYCAGTDPTRWPLFLERLHRVLDGRIVGLVVHDMRTLNGAFSFNFGIDPEMAIEYRDYWAARNVWQMNGLELNLPGNVRVSEERFRHSDLHKTEFWGFLRRVNVAHGVAGTIMQDGSLTADITVLRPRKAFGEDARRLLGALMPHLRRALRTHRRLARARLEENAVLTVLDRLTSGVILVDRTAQPLFVNTEARRVVAQRNGLVIERGGLTAARPADTRTLRGLIARASVAGGGGGSMALGRTDQRPLGIDVVPLSPPADYGLTPRVVAVFVLDPDRRVENDERLLARLYQLTPAEAGLAVRLGAGDSLDDAAERLQISRETARTQLRRVLQKTGARRQPELILRLLSHPLRIGLERDAG